MNQTAACQADGAGNKYEIEDHVLRNEMILFTV